VIALSIDGAFSKVGSDLGSEAVDISCNTGVERASVAHPGIENVALEAELHGAT
jgi:hypothetical protein